MATKGLKNRGRCAIVLLELSIALIGAMVIGSPYPWGPVVEQEAVCIAAARTPEGAVVRRAKTEPAAGIEGRGVRFP